MLCPEILGWSLGYGNHTCRLIKGDQFIEFIVIERVYNTEVNFCIKIIHFRVEVCYLYIVL